MSIQTTQSTNKPSKAYTGLSENLSGPQICALFEEIFAFPSNHSVRRPESGPNALWYQAVVHTEERSTTKSLVADRLAIERLQALEIYAQKHHIVLDRTRALRACIEQGMSTAAIWICQQTHGAFQSVSRNGTPILHRGVYKGSTAVAEALIAHTQRWDSSGFFSLDPTHGHLALQWAQRANKKYATEALATHMLTYYRDPELLQQARAHLFEDDSKSVRTVNTQTAQLLVALKEADLLRTTIHTHIDAIHPEPRRLPDSVGASRI